MRVKRRQCGDEGWSHAETYRGWNPAAFIHRARLRRILAAVRSLGLGDAGRFADFGCSDGFVLEHVQREVLTGRGWSFEGFDVNRKMLDLAEKRGLERTAFRHVDLNLELDPCHYFGSGFDVVTCFESLEHMGRWRSGVRNVLAACKPGGFVVLSVPNETGVPGLIKFVGRKILDRAPYARFFATRDDERHYLRALLRGEDLSVFRDPRATGWGEHLGFDVRRFEAVLLGGPCAGPFRLVRRSRGLADFGRLYVMRRVASGSEPTGAW